MAKSKDYEMAIRIAGEIEKSFYNSTKLTKKELQSIARQASKTSETVSETFARELKEAAPVFEGIQSTGRVAFEAVAAAATVAATAVAAVTTASIAVGASFEAQMSSVQAISGASGTDMEKLSSLAKELGASTKYTATEVGQAMEYMAMAGWKTNDMLSGMSGVLSLASASGEDLATTSDIVTDAMTAFGLGADQVEHFADVLAATATNSNTTVSMMGETFTYAASIAGALGYSIEDVSVAIGLMANSGIKESQAGTALRKILTETAGGAEVTSEALGEYVIKTQNADGSMRELGETIADLRYAFSQMTEAEKAANAESIAGKTGMSGLLAIVNAGEADYQKLTGAIYECRGAAEEMANIKIDNLSGDVTIMKSALEGLGIQIYEDINDPLRTGVQWFTELIGKASTKLSESGIIAGLTAKTPTAVRRTRELAGAIGDFAEPFFKVGGWLLDNPGVIVGAITAVGSALAVYKIASGIMSITAALSALNPVGLAILGIGAVVGVIAGIGTAIKKADNEAKKANLAKHFGDIALSLEELQEVAGYIVSSDSIGQVREALRAFDDLGQIETDIQDSIRAIEKMNWKVSIGMELTESDRDQYMSEIQSYVAQCQQYVQDKQYAVNLAVGVLTDDDLEGSNIVNQINTFYAGKQQELANLGTQLNATVTDAFQDGLLDMDEVEEITQLQQQMARIQSAIAGNNFDAKLDLLQMKLEGGELDAETFQNLQAEIQKQMEEAIADFDESYTLSVAQAKIQLEDGAIDIETYNSWVNEFREKYLDQVGEIELKATNFQMNTIMSQYDEELSMVMPEFKEMVQTRMSELFSEENSWEWETRSPFLWNGIIDELEKAKIQDEPTRQAIYDLLELMQPSVEQLEDLAQKYRAAGQKVPESIQEGINNANMIGALIGDTDAIWGVVADNIAGNESYVELMDTLKEKGYYIPEEVAQAIGENTEPIRNEINNLYENADLWIRSVFSLGFDAGTDVRIHVNPIYDSNGNLKGPYSNEYIEHIERMENFP